MGGMVEKRVEALAVHSHHIAHAQDPTQFRVITWEAEKYLDRNQVATVIVAVEANHRVDVSSSSSAAERADRECEAGKKNLADLTDTLQSAMQDGSTIVFNPRLRDSSMKLTASSRFVRSLAQRVDVTDIYLPS
jgi:hypothetical protein